MVEAGWGCCLWGGLPSVAWVSVPSVAWVSAIRASTSRGVTLELLSPYTVPYDQVRTSRSSPSESLGLGLIVLSLRES